MIYANWTKNEKNVGTYSKSEYIYKFPLSF